MSEQMSLLVIEFDCCYQSTYVPRATRWLQHALGLHETWVAQESLPEYRLIGSHFHAWKVKTAEPTLGISKTIIERMYACRHDSLTYFSASPALPVLPFMAPRVPGLPFRRPLTPLRALAAGAPAASDFRCFTPCILSWFYDRSDDILFGRFSLFKIINY